MKAAWLCGVSAGILTASILAGTGAWAGEYPDKTVTVLADSAAGSTPDVALRVVADVLGKRWGQQVIVVNRPGASGSIAARAAAEATPDGYTLYQPVSSTFVTLHPAAPNVPLQVPRDFLPIGFVAENPMFLAVSPSLGVHTLPELIALAQKGPVSYATTGIGRLTHLTGELLQHEAHIKLELVPYVGGPAHAIGDVSTGRVNLIIEGFSGIAGAVHAGSINLIAVASAKRLADFPNVPTVAETIPNFEAVGWGVLVAPLKTPDAIIKKVSAELEQVVSLPDVKKKLAPLGSYTRAMDPAQATTFVHDQQKLWGPVLADIVREEKKK